MNLVESNTSSDWRKSIIEADIILYEMLSKMGYDGNSIGDRLKQIEESDFITLNKAWEAHKIRNHIAHRGGDFTFSKGEAERVINLYRQVFEEFYYI
jgi:metal-dependent HD superfamily phosphatase/phosphodiesterase